MPSIEASDRAPKLTSGPWRKRHPMLREESSEMFIAEGKRVLAGQLLGCGTQLSELQPQRVARDDASCRNRQFYQQVFEASSFHTDPLCPHE